MDLGIICFVDCNCKCEWRPETQVWCVKVRLIWFEARVLVRERTILMLWKMRW